MNQPETVFWNLIRRCLPGVAERVENSCVTGMPDVNGTWDGHDYWVELKSVSVVPRNVANLLGASQKAWAHRRLRAGAICLLVARLGDQVAVYVPARAHGECSYRLGVKTAFYKKLSNFLWLDFTDTIKRVIYLWGDIF